MLRPMPAGVFQVRTLSFEGMVVSFSTPTRAARLHKGARFWR